MKHRHWISSAAGLACAFALLASTDLGAWALYTPPQSLSLSQRDFRVFNNFADSTANDNVIADANFPGELGASLAFWKAGVEWGSRLHGSGNGDPHQPGALGSGGANFDYVWQGEATGVGNQDDNTISELAGSSGGTLAFTELPITDGWRIRFYRDAATWNDGPTTPNGQYDLQGVGTHELGHALGLGHTGVPGATMGSTASSPAVTDRSISSDDIGGVQANYGVATAAKPIISSIGVTPGQLVLNGSNFSPSNNEVWFTPNTTGGSGVPVKVTGLTSGGTSITVAVPLTAGPGDVFVKVPGTAHDDLSNGWPFAPDLGPPCDPPENVCVAGPNAIDPFGAIMYYGGTQSVAANNFILYTVNLNPNVPGLYFFGNSEIQTPFGHGYRCIGNPVTRLGIVFADIFGGATWNLNLNSATVAGKIGVGDVRYFQFWYRYSPGGVPGYNLSDALKVMFCP